MKPKNWKKALSAVALSSALLVSVPGEVFAGQVYLDLSGSGPVYSHTFQPGNGQVRLTVNNHNNLNVGVDVIDQYGHVIANGTVKKKGRYQFLGTTHAGRIYKVRLRCQQLKLNKTKCSASAQAVW